ncbi:MAG: VIT and VWA domain-containing protein [Bacteroidota bacterium]
MIALTQTKNYTSLIIGLLLILTSISLLTVSAKAQTQEEDQTQSPYFVVLSKNNGTESLPLKSTKASVNITGVIADVTITQSYKNEGKSPIEAIYTFPASSNAAIYAMEMTIGSRKITAKIEEKNKARQQYETAKSEGKRTSLLEQQRPNVFQMNVANIMPSDQIDVVLKYTEMIVPEEGTYEFVYPTVVGPRYSEKSSQNDGFVNTPYTRNGTEAPYNFDIQLHLSTGVPIQSLTSNTHQITVNYPQPNEASVKLEPSETNGGNRDFILSYQLAGDQIESGLMLYEHEDENFFMLMVQPPKRVVKEEIPPREYIFIVDVSGSMRGFPIDISKKLMRNLVVNLRPTDKFNVMVFAGTSGWMAEQSVSAIPENISRAVKFIEEQRGSGSTNLLSAMEKALTFPRCEEGLSRSFIVVTDGYISVEKEVFEMIRTKSDQANMFAFGIGSSINRHLIEGMAHVGMSEPLMILSPEGADEKAEKFRKYINYPVLTNMQKVFKGFDAYDVEPVSIPDLLAERPLIIHGKYCGDAEGSITIKGQAGGKKYIKTFNVCDASPSDKHAALRYLWARRKIQMLDDYGLLVDGSQNKNEVTQLGLKYNLMTAYTSFIAIEEDLIANDGQKAKTVKQPLPLPENVSDAAVGFELEIEGEELEFSFHKEIVVDGYIEIMDEVAVISDVADKVVTRLNKFFNIQMITPESIVFTINHEGKIEKVSINGKQLTPEYIKNLKSLIINSDRIKNPSEGLLEISILF